jgi:CBS domain-containing protein
MSTKSPQNTLSGLTVDDAMRRQVIRLSRYATIADGIGSLIKYKINAFLTTDENGSPAGVVSKTDIMGAFYAGLPIDSPLEHIMSSPPLFCKADTSLETALEIMRSHGVYRLYITAGKTGELVGALAYPDIVGLLYRYCHGCEHSRFTQKRRKQNHRSIRRFTVKEVMTKEVKALGRHHPLSRVMETLSAYRFGAMLITAADHKPSGVISKTDLALAYKHGLDPAIPAETIMTAPVRACSEDELLEEAIRLMIFSDVHRIFVHGRSPDQIVGVLSLTDAARRRSGSCHACVSSRIKVETHP